jgi:hypothetical protein
MRHEIWMKQAKNVHVHQEIGGENALTLLLLFVDQ